MAMIVVDRCAIMFGRAIRGAQNQVDIVCSGQPDCPLSYTRTRGHSQQCGGCERCQQEIDPLPIVIKVEQMRKTVWFLLPTPPPPHGVNLVGSRNPEGAFLRSTTPREAFHAIHRSTQEKPWLEIEVQRLGEGGSYCCILFSTLLMIPRNAGKYKRHLNGPGRSISPMGFQLAIDLLRTLKLSRNSGSSFYEETTLL